MSKVDLHIHSTASDGSFSPEEIVQKAAALGLTVIALADHDCVDGIAPALEAVKDFPQLRVIPCVEISTDTEDSEVHILGFFIDYTDGELKTSLESFRSSRQGRAQGMIDKLAKLGIHIEWERVQQLAGDGSMGRPHIAQAMLEGGYITSLQEAFSKYIGYDGPAYVKREKMTPAEVVALIRQVHGLPVLAHPLNINNPETMIIELKTAGLAGIETYYKNYTTDEIKLLLGWADTHHLITTGGTDYHGLDDNGEIMMGGVEVPIESAERLIALAGQQPLKSAQV